MTQKQDNKVSNGKVQSLEDQKYIKVKIKGQSSIDLFIDDIKSVIYSEFIPLKQSGMHSTFFVQH
jgi:hypothetical protein